MSYHFHLSKFKPCAYAGALPETAALPTAPSTSIAGDALPPAPAAGAEARQHLTSLSNAQLLLLLLLLVTVQQLQVAHLPPAAVRPSSTADSGNW